MTAIEEYKKVMDEYNTVKSLLDTSHISIVVEVTIFKRPEGDVERMGATHIIKNRFAESVDKSLYDYNDRIHKLKLYSVFTDPNGNKITLFHDVKEDYTDYSDPVFIHELIQRAGKIIVNTQTTANLLSGKNRVFGVGTYLVKDSTRDFFIDSNTYDFNRRIFNLTVSKEYKDDAGILVVVFTDDIKIH